MTAHTPDGGELTEAEREALWRGAGIKLAASNRAVREIEYRVAAILAARSAPDAEVVAAAWDEGYSAAHGLGHPDNPYRRAAGVREGREGGGEG